MSVQNVSVLNPNNHHVIEIDAELASAWLDAGEVILLDVREQEELEIEWIPGATPMPLSKFDAAAVADMPALKIVTICLVGRRSIEAAEKLVEYGLGDVYSVKDGLLAWNAAGLDSIDQSALLI